MKTSTVLSLAAAVATATLFANTASASRILVDLGATDVAGTTTATAVTGPIYNVSTPPTGQPTNGLSWNNWNVVAFGGVTNGTGIANLVDTTNTSTGIGITLGTGTTGTAAFSGTNGLTAANAGYPYQGVHDYFYPTNNTTPFTFTLSNLDPSAKYDITLFVGRNGTANTQANSRAAIYTVTGDGAPIVSPNLEAALGTNTAVVWTASQVTPLAGANTITVKVATGTWFDGTNNVTSGGGLLGGMDITVPEPTSLGMLGLAGLALVRRRSK